MLALTHLSIIGGTGMVPLNAAGSLQLELAKYLGR